MSFPPINTTNPNLLNRDMSKTETSKEVSNLIVLHGDDSNAEGLLATLDLIKNYVLNSSNHSMNLKLTQD
jgi:hypothetical protein